MNKRKVGENYETLACEYLQNQGLEILERNFYTRKGEIDIIAMDREILCFIEVKYRKDLSLGTPQEAVNPRKQRAIYETARFYMYTHHIPFSCPCRFDVVAVLDKEITYIQNAYGGL